MALPAKMHLVACASWTETDLLLSWCFGHSRVRDIGTCIPHVSTIPKLLPGHASTLHLLHSKDASSQHPLSAPKLFARRTETRAPPPGFLSFPNTSTNIFPNGEALQGPTDPWMTGTPFAQPR